MIFLSKTYNRNEAITYAKKWAYSRNPKYYNFDNVGGDCTAFVSQCIYAGCKTMNYTKYLGWYYINGKDKSPSWSGVEYLYQFLIKNKGSGPSAQIVSNEEIQIGDVIQLKFHGAERYSHSLFVVGKQNVNIYIASHTEDSYYRNLFTYYYEEIRYLHLNNGVK